MHTPPIHKINPTAITKKLALLILKIRKSKLAKRKNGDKYIAWHLSSKKEAGPPLINRTLLSTIALGCGLAASYTTHQLLTKKIADRETVHQEIETKAQTHKESRKIADHIAVIVAKTMITPGMRLGKHNLSERFFPRDLLPSYALEAEQFSQLDNQISAYHIHPGDILSTSLLKSAVDAIPTRLTHNNTPHVKKEANNKPHRAIVLYGVHQEPLHTALLDIDKSNETLQTIPVHH